MGGRAASGIRTLNPGFTKAEEDGHNPQDTRQISDQQPGVCPAGCTESPELARIVAVWSVPGTPDMGGVSPDGKVLWLAGRYTGSVYAISTRNGHVLASIPAGVSPHGLCVWPQPGRYSTGHTGVMR